MSALLRDAEFAAFVESERVLLQRCAFLLVGQRAAADDLVSATLADLYARWPRAGARREALRLLATTDPAGLRLPWSRRARFELLDTGPVREPVDPVVTDLGRLPADQRLVLVLERVALLPSVEIATVLGSGVDETLGLSRAARAGLVSLDPRRAEDSYLAGELSEAVPYDLRAPRPDDDLAHGHTLTRRRWVRRGLVGVAALVLVVLGLTQLRPTAPTPAAAPVPAATVSSTPSTRAACDKTEATCQASLVRAWRAQMAEIVIDYLDPSGSYFNGSSFYDRDQTAYLWETKQGALALEVTRFGQGGSTEVYLQIATSRAYARRCGEMTGTVCSSVRFMDGNRFTLSQTLDASEGIEAQYRPDGKDVITVVARDNGRGPMLNLHRGDLVRLVQDKNLRLPRF